MANILYIDASDKFSQSLCKFLRGEGFNVCFVHSYNDAMGTIVSGNFPPHVILCADAIKGLDCIGFLRAIREEKKTNIIPVILFTDSIQKEDCLRAMIAGAVDVISKSTDTNYLIAKLYAQSRIFSHNDNTRKKKPRLRISEKKLLAEIFTELKDLNNKIAGVDDTSQIDSILDKFSKYLTKKLA